MLVELSAAIIRFPPQCACCYGPPDGQLNVSASRSRGKRVVRTTTKSWDFPYCSACLAHVKAWQEGDSGLWIFIIMGLMLAVLMWLAGAGGALGMALLTVGIVFGFVFRSRARKKAQGMCSSSCAEAPPAVAYLGWSGTIQSFSIASHDYAAALMLANGSKLVNVDDEAREVMSEALEQRRSEAEREAAAAARRAAATRAARARAEDQEALLRWVSKLESAKGTATRRTALDAALRALENTEHRARLLEEYAAIEMHAALDKADGLKSAAAKRRTLQAAIDALAASPVPDDVRAPRIAELEQAISGAGDAAT